MFKVIMDLLLIICVLCKALIIFFHLINTIFYK